MKLAAEKLKGHKDYTTHGRLKKIIYLNSPLDPS